jgi:hypothetical protein
MTTGDGSGSSSLSKGARRVLEGDSQAAITEMNIEEEDEEEAKDRRGTTFTRIDYTGVNITFDTTPNTRSPMQTREPDLMDME